MLGWYDTLLRFVLGYNHAVILYLASVNLLYLLFLVVSLRELVRTQRTRRLVDSQPLLQSEETPAISVVSPAYNEAATILEATHALLRLHYPRFEVIVVNDGSKDNTLSILIEAFELQQLDFLYQPAIPTKPVRNVYRSPLYPRLTVVDKENGGKADSLNAGINLARHGLYCGIDADSLLEEDALLKGVYPFVRWKGKVAVTSGIIRIANGCVVDKGRVIDVRLPSEILPLFQIVEYLRIFLVGRFAWNALNSVLIVSGAFGIFDRRMVLEAGGYSTGTVGEDMELVVRLHRRMREQKDVRGIYFLPDPVCWTEAPSSWKILSRQRDRWQRGFMETLWTHRGMLFNPRYGVIGLFSFPFMVLFEMFSPIVELTGYVTLSLGFFLGVLEWQTVTLFLIVTFLFGLLTSVCGLLIEEVLFKKYRRLQDLALLLFIAFVENFGYRQINFLIRLKAFFGYFGKKKGWGKMTRTGFTRKA